MEYPGGGIYRHQFEQLVGNTVMEVIFKWVLTDQLILTTLGSSCLDTDNNGYLDFKEFNQALQLLSAKTTEQKLQWAFKYTAFIKINTVGTSLNLARLYDEDNSGEIDQAEMSNIMTVSSSQFEPN